MRRLPALLLSFLLLGACAAPDTPADPDPAQAPPETAASSLEPETDGWQIDGNIIHAGGAVDSWSVTNSLEALEAAVGAGERFIEIDFSLTADGESVCLHDWNEGILPGFEKTDFPLDLETFLAQRLYGALTPLSLADLAEWMVRHPAVCIITDVKAGDQHTLAEIARRWPDLRERFIPQIYDETELEPVRALGFTRVIYTLYRLPWEEKLDTDRVGTFAAENGLAGITFAWELTEQPGYVERLLAWGVPLFTHTLNDPAEIEAQLALGISGVYTDRIGQTAVDFSTAGCK